MKVIVTRNTFIGGKLVQASPEPIVVDDAVGKQLIGLGKAVLAPEVTGAEPAPVEPAPKEDKPKAKGK